MRRARRTATFRRARNARIRAPPRACWNASRSPSYSPKRIVRSYVGSAVSFCTTGVRASAAPTAVRVIIPVE
jgi:hypothetical protein